MQEILQIQEYMYRYVANIINIMHGYVNHIK